jgi:hypothetical protein
VSGPPPAGSAPVPPPDDPFATPETTLVSILRSFWKHRRDDAEVTERWQRYARLYPDQVGRILTGLDAALAAPPSDLHEVLAEEGWVPLYHDEPSGGRRPFSRDECVAWLRDAVAMLRSAAASPG